MIVTTLQALSGAGYPGPAAIDLVDNIIPYISGEEEKSEVEPIKIFGKVKNGKIVPDENIKISAHCNRVPVTDGHTACCSIQFAGKKPEMNEIINIWRNFSRAAPGIEVPHRRRYRQLSTVKKITGPNRKKTEISGNGQWQ